MNMLRSKPGLLFLFLVLHLANCCNGNAYVPLPFELVESQVESWVVERRSSQHMATDWFTLNMKPTFECLYQWCQFRFNAFISTVGANHSHCTCYCDKPGFSSFLPSVRKCINASMAASFAGCQGYYNRNTLLNTPVDLTRQKQNKDKTFEFRSNSICNLSASYFHDYEGFQSNWRYVTDGFFVLKKTGTKFSVQWKPDTHRMLSGRIIRLNITCGASTKCFLFKAMGSVIYKNVSSPWSSSSTTSSLPPISSSLSSSSSPSLLSSSLASDLSPVSSSLQLSLSSVLWQPSSSSLLQLKKSSVTSDLSPVSSSLQLPLSSMSWSPSSSSLLTKSSVTSISSAKLSQSSPSVKTSSPEILLLKPTSSYSTSNTLTMPPMEPSWVTPTSTAAFIEPGSKKRQIEEKGSGVLIAAAVGTTLLAGAVFLILLICWRKRRARESKRKEEKHVEVGNPVYGISNDEFQMEKAKGSAQDSQQRHQYPSNTGQLQSVGETVYSNPDSNYDNCNVYQSLEKPTPGSPVYQSLEEQIPESSLYQSLNSDQEKPSGRTALKNVSPKQSTLPNPKSSASDQLNPTAAGLGFAPNRKERGDTKRALPNTYSALTQKPTYNLRHEADAGQETTPDALYVDLEGPTSGQDYETLNGDDQYLAPIETNAQIGFENPCARKDQVYFELEGPDAQNGPEHEPSDAQEPLYNMLEDPNEGKSPKVEPSDSSFDPLYNVLEEIDSDGSKKPEPPRGHDNPAYEETLDFGHPYATPQRPGAQTESVYEPLRKASTLDPYTA